jgi:biotin synthase
MFRFVNPTTDIRIAGGREVTLRSMQPLALYAANSLFTNGYLTTPGAQPSDDMVMIQDAGFEPEMMGER